MRVTTLAKQQLVDGGAVVSLWSLLRVVAVVVLPGRPHLHELAVDVDLDAVVGGAVLEVDRELNQMGMLPIERRDVAVSECGNVPNGSLVDSIDEDHVHPVGL